MTRAAFLSAKTTRACPASKWLSLLALLLLAGGPALAQAPAANPAANATINPEKTPQYPGGFQKLFQDINRDLRYPALARKQRFTAQVLVEFIVGTDGRLYQVHVQDPVKTTAAQAPAARALEQEAVRVVSGLTTRWQPGRTKARPVAVRLAVPVQFRF